MKKKQAAYKSYLIFVAALAMILGAAADLVGAPGSDDVLAKLGLDQASARESILDSLANGSVYNDAAFKAFKSLPGLARETIVRAGLAWIKSYAAGAEFKAAYEKLREQEKPQAPEARPSADDEMKKMRAETEKSIAEMRKNMAAMDAETKKAMEGAIKEMRAQMEKMEKDPGQRDLMRQIAEMSAAEDQKHYDGELKTWEEKFPADPRALIKRRIGEFLAASADVDYAAKLVPRGDLLVFADEGYERKPAAWKLCFRAGREATATARAFAKVWLAELGKS